MRLFELFEKKLSDAAYYPIDNVDDVIIYFPKQQEQYNDKNELLGIRLALEYAIENFDVNNAHIMCYGNNLYGKEIENIWNKYPNVHIELAVCSPESPIIKEKDREILKKKIKSAEKNDNTKIYVSEIPPTLRSCILYRNEEPVLCCVQYYVMEFDNQRRPSFVGRRTPCVIACYNGKAFPLNQYVEFCELEFKRLKKSCL